MLRRLALAARLTFVSCLMASPGIAGGVPSYAAPEAPAPDETKLSTRDVTSLLFKAAPESHPDLAGKDLSRLDLAELDFKQADLSGANLYGADLTRADMAGANLRGARLNRATITSADFSNADLTDAHLLRPTIFTTLDIYTVEAPNFAGAKLVRARSDGWLDRADFAGADLTGAIFGGGASREETLFNPARLTSANFTGAVLKDARFPNAHMQYARFIDADLSGANLRGTNLLGADFTRANLAGADLTGANLDAADLRTARGLDKVIGLKQAENLESARFAVVP